MLGIGTLRRVEDEVRRELRGAYARERTTLTGAEQETEAEVVPLRPVQGPNRAGG